MAYTNITIPERFSTISQLREKIRYLEFKLKEEQNLSEDLFKELENIPEAIEQYGYVDIEWRGKKMKLVKFIVESKEETK